MQYTRACVQDHVIWPTQAQIALFGEFWPEDILPDQTIYDQTKPGPEPEPEPIIPFYYDYMAFAFAL